MADLPSAPTRPAEATTCAVVGGGPAGLVCGLLLARAGVHVTVLEKHADFLRDFRGDTVHPSTLALIDDLGLFDRFDALPHSRVSQVTVPAPDGDPVTVVDFSRLPVRHPYIAMVPQWDLLDLLADAARDEPTFDLRMSHDVTGLIREGDQAAGRVVGIEYEARGERGRLRADLVIACDGRWSTVRRAATLTAKEFPVGFDVWWFRLPAPGGVPDSLLPRFGNGSALIIIPREGYLQAAYLGRKGSDAQLRARGIEAFRAEVARLIPEAEGAVAALESMDDVKLLSVRMDRLRRWAAAGVLCIGDAAHAMSPVGGVGINLAVQDAVATAARLATPLRNGTMRTPRGDRLARRIQRRRRLPTAATQSVQRVMHRRVIARLIEGRLTAPPPSLLRLVRRFPAVTVVPAALIGVGLRPERAPAWARRAAHPEAVAEA